MSSDSGSSCYDRLLGKAAHGLPVASGLGVGQMDSPPSSNSRPDFSVGLRRCYSCMVGLRLPVDGGVGQAENIFKSLYETQLRLNEILVGKLRESEAAVRKEVVRNSRIISDYEQLISKLMRFHYWKVGRQAPGSPQPTEVLGSPQPPREGWPEPRPRPLASSESGPQPPDPSPFSSDFSAIGKPKTPEDVVRTPELHYFLCSNCGKTNALVESKVTSTNDYDSQDPRRTGRLPTPTRQSGAGVFRFSHK